MVSLGTGLNGRNGSGRSRNDGLGRGRGGMGRGGRGWGVCWTKDELLGMDR
jgi:hypothetical protein